MNTKNYSIIVLVIATLMSISSFANAGMRWCSHWCSQFTDSGVGEDVYTSTAQVYRDAAYARFQVVNLDTSEVQSGILDGLGCTPFLPVTSNTNYKFRQQTWLEYLGNRHIKVLADSSDWGGSTIYLNSYYTTSTVYSWNDYTHTFHPAWCEQHANTITAATAIITKSLTISYNADTTTQVHVYDSCGGTYYSSGTDRICIDTNYNLNTPVYNHSNYKFVIAHEFGHRQAYPLDGPADGASGGTYYPDVTNPCSCHFFVDLGAPWSDPGGCFQNQRHIGSAQKDAFAHFYAAATFNDRDEADCGFAYWRAAYESTLPLADDPDVLEDYPLAIDCRQATNWMEGYCFNSNYRGTSQDWLSFFYRLWAFGTYRYSINEIDDVWDHTVMAYPDTSGQRWSELVTALSVLGYSANKIAQFTDTGNVTGVNH